MSSTNSSDGFLPSDDDERWVAIGQGIPISQLVRGDVSAGGAPSPAATTGFLPSSSAQVMRAVIADRNGTPEKWGLFGRNDRIISRVFEGAYGSPRPELESIDAILEQRQLDPMDFARVFTRLMNWEEGKRKAARGRGKCHAAHLVLARLRQRQPIGDEIYKAVLKVLGMPAQLIQTHVHSILTSTPMPKPVPIPSWNDR